jgi:hypothetical protein
LFLTEPIEGRLAAIAAFLHAGSDRALCYLGDHVCRMTGVRAIAEGFNDLTDLRGSTWRHAFLAIVELLLRG